MGSSYKSGGKQDDNDDLNNVRSLASKRRKIATITAKATKLVVEKLLTVLTKAALKKKRRDQQDRRDMSVRKV